MANKLIIENANWLRTYNSAREREALSALPIVRKIQWKSNVNIVDIGCGNGRSLRLLSTLFPHAHINALDKIEENIQYAKQNIASPNIEFTVCDAVEYFSSANKGCDLAFFSWSFFDMINDLNRNSKEKKLNAFLDNIVFNLNDDGAIIVLQPTKGGTFENLLSLFMPSSDEIYAFTHSFLKSHGFTGPETIIPSRDDPLGIWSEFKYQNDNELFYGIASILSLEMNEVLTREKYYEILHVFREKNKLPEDKLLILNDCVNIYYLHKVASHT